MKRADRLYALMQRLKDGRVHTAETLADELSVSVRTIYRDMETLAASGVPVEGARGYGYTARASVTLPPLNLTDTELDALHLALAALGASDMKDMADAAHSLSAKIEAVLPEDAGPMPARFGFATYPFAEAAGGFAHMPRIRAAIRARQRLRISLRDEGKTQDIRPLHLDYWGRIWTCVAWSDTEGDFLTFRIDRIADLTALPGLFVEEPGKSLADWRAQTATQST